LNPVPEDGCLLILSWNDRVDYATAAPRIGAYYLEVATAEVPLPRRAVCGGEHLQGKLSGYGNGLLEPLRVRRSAEDPEAVPQGVVAESSKDVGIGAIAFHFCICGALGHIFENVLDLQKTNQVEAMLFFGLIVFLSR